MSGGGRKGKDRTLDIYTLASSAVNNMLWVCWVGRIGLRR